MQDAYILFIVLACTLGMFIWGYYTYDTIALMSLMALVTTGVVPYWEAFSGFSNSAVISVAAVMIISNVIINTGFVDLLLEFIKPILTSPTTLIIFICVLGAVLSAFMNNVGALSLLMPVAIQGAINAKLSPSKILMPLSFATVLGGMITKIGTPPNLLISSYKEEVTGVAFSMFDFAPTGFFIALGGLAFITLLGWHYLPERRRASADAKELYQIQDYISEIVIPKNSPVVGMVRHELEELIEGDFSILGMIRGRSKKLVIPANEELKANDILIIEASHDDLDNLINKGKLELSQGDVISASSLKGKDISTIEAVVPPGSRMQGRSWQRQRVRSRLNLNLLAIARAGKAIKNRLNHVNFNPGDILLIQGAQDDLRENIINLGLVPLAERNINVGFKRNMILPIALFVGGILLASFQILSIEVAFTLVVTLMAVLNIIPMRQAYKSIDWSIIVMLGALIPMGSALTRTGAAEKIGQLLMNLTGHSSPIIMITLLLVLTMTLSDVINNAAAAVIMAPIGFNLAQLSHLSPDAFLIAVSIGASCSFLTPISHQNNTIVMGPGGYKFFDYLWLGMPLELIVVLISVPTLFLFWL